MTQIQTNRKGNPLSSNIKVEMTYGIHRKKREHTNDNNHKCHSYLRESDSLGLVGPDRRGFRPIQSFSPLRLSTWSNKQRSSSFRRESSHWTRHSGARDTFSFISKGANFPHAAASVWKRDKTYCSYIFTLVKKGGSLKPTVLTEAYEQNKV